MKKTGLAIVLLAIVTVSFSQSPQQVNQLATLGKLWGFLKYYHPAALKGKPDWDKELVRMIPLARQSKPGNAFTRLLEDWYRSLPAASLAATAADRQADSIVQLFSEKEIQQWELPASLKEELVRLYRFHKPDSSRYVTRYYDHYRFDHIIHTEDSYDTPVYPSAEMRLLALFRYWNTINYFYPHRQRITGWEKILNQYIPLFLAAKDSIGYRMAIRRLIHELPDSHSFIQQPGEVYYYYPFRIDYIEGKYLIGRCDELIAKANDYRLGDEVIAVNGQPVKDREKELLKTTTGTNPLSLYRNVAQELLKAGDSVIQVTFKRMNEVFTRPVELHTWEVYSKLKRSAPRPLWKEINTGTWYVRFCRITNPDTLVTLFRQINSAKAVIWDMRDYPSFPVTTLLPGYFFTQPQTITEERNAWDFFPGSFIKSPYSVQPVSTNDSLVYKGRLIILVDEYTQSLSESVAAMLLLRPNSITMGRQTAGTTGNITWLSLPGKIEVSYTGVGVTGSRQSFVQGDGVRIDIPVTLSAAAIRSSNDYILEQAIRYAEKEPGNQ